MTPLAALLVLLPAVVAATISVPILSYNIRSGSNINNVYNISLTGATIAAFKPLLAGAPPNNTSCIPPPLAILRS